MAGNNGFKGVECPCCNDDSGINPDYDNINDVLKCRSCGIDLRIRFDIETLSDGDEEHYLWLERDD